MASSYLDQIALPRGLRNNNPGNLRAGEDWKGEVGEDRDGFVIFQDMSWGIRAMATLIMNDISRGYNTLSSLIGYWAPAEDHNPTSNYIASVASSTGLNPNQVIPLELATLAAIMRGMINFELGAGYKAMVSNDDIQEGIELMNSNLLSLLKQAKQSPGVQLATLLLVLLVGYTVYKGLRR